MKHLLIQTSASVGALFLFFLPFVAFPIFFLTVMAGDSDISGTYQFTYLLPIVHLFNIVIIYLLLRHESKVKYIIRKTVNMVKNFHPVWSIATLILVSIFFIYNLMIGFAIPIVVFLIGVLFSKQFNKQLEKWHSIITWSLSLIPFIIFISYIFIIANIG